MGTQDGTQDGDEVEIQNSKVSVPLYEVWYTQYYLPYLG